MTSTKVHHIPLPHLTSAMLAKLARFVQIAISDSLLPSSRSIEQTQGEIIKLIEERAARPSVRFNNKKLSSSDDIFKFVLRLLWSELVEPVINLLEIKVKDADGVLPVIHWCPTGHFTLLPIHAAGLYDNDQPIVCASDYFISSYTPTIGALLIPDPISTQPFKMLIVIQSESLPATKKELENIRRHVPPNSLSELGDSGTSAGIEEVASHLQEASIVHFACHGLQDPTKPLNSGLKLEDGFLGISRIMQERQLNGSLAFLCACQTGKGDDQLPDEALSLGASLLFSGFRRVVATMWEMRDEDGPKIADAFYEELFRGPDGKPALVPDTTKSARALHLAVKKLRLENVSFRRWLPFIHMGK